MHKTAADQTGLNTSLQQSVVFEPGEQVIFKGLPVELIQEIASYLPLPDLVQLKQTCRATNHCITSFIIKEAKQRYSVEFRYMNKVEIKKPDLYSDHMRMFQINNNGSLVSDTFRVPDIKMVSLNFVFTRFLYPDYEIQKPKESRGLNDALSIHMGQFENGRCFMLALNPRLSKRFLSFRKQHQMIGYAGDTNPTPWLSENNHSLYCGRSYEEAIKTFELACQGTDIANHIRKLLGFHRIYY